MLILFNNDLIVKYFYLKTFTNLARQAQISMSFKEYCLQVEYAMIYTLQTLQIDAFTDCSRMLLLQ